MVQHGILQDIGHNVLTYRDSFIFDYIESVTDMYQNGQKCSNPTYKYIIAALELKNEKAQVQISLIA